MEDINKSNKALVNKYASSDIDILLKDFNISDSGLTKKQVEQNSAKYGKNEVKTQKYSILSCFYNSFINAFNIVLFVLGIISLFTDIIFANVANYTTFIITITMVFISSIIRLIQEIHSLGITNNVVRLIDTSSKVLRDNEIKKLDYKDIVVGDKIYLKAGDKLACDVRIINAKDLFVSEALITGESEIKEKDSKTINQPLNNINSYTNILFQGTNIVSGECVGIVLCVGDNVVNGNLSIVSKNKKHGFNQENHSIIWVLIKFMAILIPIVFIASGITKGDWLSAFLFSLSVAVGLTPELLPMIITACLAKGSFNMAKKQTIIKNINAMNELGTMDILCVDKTGTLTQDKLVLEYYMDIIGNENQDCLDMAYINSYLSSGIKNHIDNAILQIKETPNKKDHYQKIISNIAKLDEIPFNYDRKISSVLIRNNKEKYLICKGSINDIVNRCNYINYKNSITDIGKDKFNNVSAVTDEMANDGMKLIAIAYKKINKNSITPKDENNLILLGYLAFFDAPKQSAYDAIKKINDLNIKIKILTGDNLKVATSIAKRLGFNVDQILTGAQLDNLNDNEAQLVIEKTNVFVELSPMQKRKIVSILQSNGHTVGFIGDGLNDIKAMNEANISISVDNAAPSLKQTADVVLIKKDLDVLANGVIEGRKSFINMSKYIKITASSNLGNILSIILCSIFLPFFPMTSIQLLLLNLLYDLLCLIIPFDKVDDDLIKSPSSWNSHNLTKFMLYFAPISCIFDIITFVFLFFYICPIACNGSYFDPNINQNLFVSIFQTGWFLESMWTQILILHLLRSNKLPFIQSQPSKIVSLITVLGIIIFTIFAVTPLGSFLNLSPLPWIYYIFLIGIVLCYLIAVSAIKKLYIKLNKSLL